MRSNRRIQNRFDFVGCWNGILFGMDIMQCVHSVIIIIAYDDDHERRLLLMMIILVLAFAHTEKENNRESKFEMGDRYRIIDLSHTITDAFITCLFPV